MNREQMTAMFDAFNRHAIDEVMEYFAGDVVFDTVSGDEAHGTRIVSECTFMATQPDGLRIEADSVDLFTIEQGKITRKQRPAFTPGA